MAEIILGAEGLRYSYGGGRAALDDVNLSVRQGSRLALLGANGSGKTTLLLHLNGTLKAQSGRVRVGGAPARHDSSGLLAWRQRVGLVFQDPDDQLFAATVRQDISFGPVNLELSDDEIRARVEEAMRTLCIEELAGRPTHMLSHGQKKLVAMAGVLAMRPDVIILDEPTAGLDSGAAERLLLTLDRLHQKGTTLILATHDIDMVYAWADEVALMQDGRMIRQGAPAEILRDAETLAMCRLRTPWAMEIAMGFEEWAGVRNTGTLPRTQSGVLSYGRQLSRHVALRGPDGDAVVRRDLERTAILLVAFGSTVAGTRRTYSAIEEEVRRHFPDRTVVWAFTSRTVRKHCEESGGPVHDPQEALDALRAKGYRRVVVQSLHVMQGEEYRRLLSLDAGGMKVEVGVPLLSSGQDIAEVAAILGTMVRGDRPNVICGHGNGKHPELNEPLLRLAEAVEAGCRDTVVATIEGPPGTESFGRIADRAARAGCAHFIPLMLVSGIHVADDILGEGDASWKQRLAVREASLAPPLGELPEIRAILVRHIRDAETRG